MIIFKTMGAASRRAKRIRKAAEFDVSKRLSRELRQPRDGRNTINAWSLENIFAAREAQMLGHFVLPARMAEQMRTDDALAVAYENRLAPQRCLPVEIVPAKGARGVSIAGEADALFRLGEGFHQRHQPQRRAGERTLGDRGCVAFRPFIGRLPDGPGPHRHFSSSALGRGAAAL